MLLLPRFRLPVSFLKSLSCAVAVRERWMQRYAVLCFRSSTVSAASVVLQAFRGQGGGLERTHSAPHLTYLAVYPFLSRLAGGSVRGGCKGEGDQRDVQGAA